MNRVACRWILLTAGGISIGAFAALQVPIREPRPSGKVGPAAEQGVVMNPLGALHPGDPANAERDFRVIYRAMDAFRRKRRRLPSLGELTGTPANHYKGLVPADAWTNPDSAYEDGANPEQWAKGRFQYMFSYQAPRFDGTVKPAFPKNGERDVWMVARQCVRQNMVLLPNHHARYRLAGCFVVLWSDGRIERVPTAKELVVRKNARRWNFCFAGEAGIPKSARPMSLVEYYISIHQFATAG